MFRLWISAVVGCVTLGWLGQSAFSLDVGDEVIVARGDANSSGSVDTADGIFINAWLFNGGPEPPCQNQADVNSDGEITIADSSHLFNWLFMGGAEPPYPGPYNTSCAADPEPYVSCNRSPCL